MSVQGRDSGLQRPSKQPRRLQSLTDRQYLEAVKPEGLFCIHEPGESRRLDVVFVHNLFGRPIGSWRSDWNIFWPVEFLAQDLEYARLWTFGWIARMGLTLPAIANNLGVALSQLIDNRRLEGESRSDMREGAARLPLVFVCAGFGGIVVKKLLVDCRVSTSTGRHSIWTYCTGLIFYSVPHLASQDALPDYITWLRRSSAGPGSGMSFKKDLTKETEIINQHFLSILASAPPAFCIVQLPSEPSLRWGIKPYIYYTRFKLSLEVPNEANATFAARKNDDSNYTVHSNSTSLWFSHRSQLYYLIVSRLRQWQSGPLNQEPEPEAACPEATAEGLRLLSLDGGGVRGLCSLLVLDKLMYEIKKLELVDKPETRDWPRLPCRYFDLCGGTSTGGYVIQGHDEIFKANNRVSLQSFFFVWLDTSTAIADYKQLAPQIFKSGIFGQAGKIGKAMLSKPWFKAKPFEQAIRGVIKERLPFEEKEVSGDDPKNARMLPPTTELRGLASRMFVCAWNASENCTTRFCNYSPETRPHQTFDDCTIWEAARATSAAPFYFPAAHVNGVKYWDGGVENNNPINEVFTENGANRVKCCVSLGTGMSERKETKGLIPVFGRVKRLAKILTQTETNHKRYKERLAAEGVPYFRFNPTTKQDDIGLDEYKRLNVLEKHTRDYLAREDIAADIKRAALILAGPSELQGHDHTTTDSRANAQAGNDGTHQPQLREH